MCYGAMQTQAMKTQLGPWQFTHPIRSSPKEAVIFPLLPMAYGFRDPESGAKTVSEGQFGLVPDWIDESRGGPKYARKWSTYNARSEGIFGKPTFREAIIKRRAVIPVDEYYEFADRQENFKFRVYREDAKPIWIAGLWEYNSAYKLNSCSMITTEPMPLIKDLHSRSPLVILESQIDAWLDPAMKSPDAISKFFVPGDSSPLRWEKVPPKPKA